MCVVDDLESAESHYMFYVPTPKRLSFNVNTQVSCVFSDAINTSRKTLTLTRFHITAITAALRLRNTAATFDLCPSSTASKMLSLFILLYNHHVDLIMLPDRPRNKVLK